MRASCVYSHASKSCFTACSLRHTRYKENLGEITDPGLVGIAEHKTTSKYGQGNRLAKRPRIIRYSLKIFGEGEEAYFSIFLVCRLSGYESAAKSFTTPKS